MLKMRVIENFSTSKLSSLLDLLASKCSHPLTGKLDIPYNIIFGNPTVETAKDGYMQFSSPKNCCWRRRMHVYSSWKVIREHQFSENEPIEVEWQVQNERLLKNVSWTTLKLSTFSKDNQIMIEERRILGYLPSLYETERQELKIPANFDFSHSWKATGDTLRNYADLINSGHKIHLDRKYCLEVEGYPDLVVQGTLLASVMMSAFERCRGNSVSITGFNFKAISPAFVGQDITIAGSFDGDVWAFRSNPGPCRLLATGHISFRA